MTQPLWLLHLVADMALYVAECIGVAAPGDLLLPMLACASGAEHELAYYEPKAINA